MEIKLNQPANKNDKFFIAMITEMMDQGMMSELIIKSSRYIEINKKRNDEIKVDNWIYVYERLLECYRYKWDENDLINYLLKIINS